jgi:hypothetical protein
MQQSVANVIRNFKKQESQVFGTAFPHLHIAHSCGREKKLKNSKNMHEIGIKLWRNTSNFSLSS